MDKTTGENKPYRGSQIQNQDNPQHHLNWLQNKNMAIALAGFLTVALAAFAGLLATHNHNFYAIWCVFATCVCGLFIPFKMYSDGHPDKPTESEQIVLSTLSPVFSTPIEVKPLKPPLNPDKPTDTPFDIAPYEIVAQLDSTPAIERQSVISGLVGKYVEWPLEFAFMEENSGGTIEASFGDRNFVGEWGPLIVTLSLPVDGNEYLRFAQDGDRFIVKGVIDSYKGGSLPEIRLRNGSASAVAP